MERVKVEVPDPLGVRATFDGLRDGVGPEREEDPERTTVPVNPFRLVRVILATPEVPA